MSTILALLIGPCLVQGTWNTNQNSVGLLHGNGDHIIKMPPTAVRPPSAPSSPDYGPFVPVNLQTGAAIPQNRISRLCSTKRGLRQNAHVISGVFMFSACVAYVVVANAIESGQKELFGAMIGVGVAWAVFTLVYGISTYVRHGPDYQDSFLLHSALGAVGLVYGHSHARNLTLAQALAIAPPVVSMAMWTSSLRIDSQRNARRA
jgi:hypothetical protein